MGLRNPLILTRHENFDDVNMSPSLIYLHTSVEGDSDCTEPDSAESLSTELFRHLCLSECQIIDGNLVLVQLANMKKNLYVCIYKEM